MMMVLGQSREIVLGHSRANLAASSRDRTPTALSALIFPPSILVFLGTTNIQTRIHKITSWSSV